MDFHQDETGARRWWVTPVRLPGDQQNNVKWVEENRLGIWKAALNYYRAGEPNYFENREDERLNEELNQDFSDVTVIYDHIEGYFNFEPHPCSHQEHNNKDHIPYEDLLDWCKSKTNGESDTKLQKMIKIEMARRGFEYKKDTRLKVAQDDGSRSRCDVQ